MATTPTTRVTALARRYRLDIDTGTYPATNYAQLMGVEDAKLIEELRTEDDEMYEDGGAGRDAVTGYRWRIEAKLAFSTNPAGTALDTVHAFLRAMFVAARDGSNVAGAEFGVRWYDRAGLDSGDASEGRVYVKSWTPGGGKGRDMVDIVLAGQGAIANITNPASDLTPTVTGLSPATGPAAGGDLVQVMGSHFAPGGTADVTAVEFGTSAAADFAVISDSLLVAVAPAGVAGTVQVKVTTSAGVSADTTADDYTYV